jgi:hypothetical protein
MGHSGGSPVIYDAAHPWDGSVSANLESRYPGGSRFWMGAAGPPGVPDSRGRYVRKVIQPNPRLLAPLVERGVGFPPFIEDLSLPTSSLQILGRTQNLIHQIKIGQPLRSSPQHGYTWLAVTISTQKPSQTGDHSQALWCVRRAGGLMDCTVQGLPLSIFKQDGARCVWNSVDQHAYRIRQATTLNKANSRFRRSARNKSYTSASRSPIETK